MQECIKKDEPWVKIELRADERPTTMNHESRNDEKRAENHEGREVVYKVSSSSISCIILFHILYLNLYKCWSVQGYCSDGFSLPGQCLTKQFFDSIDGPTQSAPLFCGMGLLHSRDRYPVPFPHVSLQADQGPQSDQCPSTGTTVEQRIWTKSISNQMYLTDDWDRKLFKR